MTATHRVRGVEESPEIRETLEHIGELMRLPPKRPTVATQAAEVPEAVKSNKMGKVPMLPVLAVIAIIAAGVVALWPKEPAAVPTALQREWRTDHADYGGRRIAFTSSAVLITAAANQAATVYPIVSVSAEQRADSVRVVVTYTENGGPVALEASLVDGAQPKLVFTRPSGLVWTPSAP